MKKILIAVLALTLSALVASGAWAAYDHAGEKDSKNFLAVYPDKAGSKLDSCALCHSGGETTNSRGKTIKMGSCQWCHNTYGYDGSGNIIDTLNNYGKAYLINGRNAAAVSAIAGQDSDGDGYVNSVEVAATRYPGDASDDPSKVPAPSRIYTMGQIQDLGGHTQFMLMNTSRSGDYYAQYTGLTMEKMLEDAGVLSTANMVTAYAPDGFSNDYLINQDADSNLYYCRGEYPQAVFQYNTQADTALNPEDGWCDYSAPSARGRTHGEAIAVDNGLRMILAYAREGAPLQTGILNDRNTLDGEGPFRVAPPQKVPCPPDQSSRAQNQDVIWPYEYSWDHNAGFSARTVTILKVSPLPEGTTDIDVLEAGWVNVDLQQVVVYGALDGSDSNGNGVLDSEEGRDASLDYNDNGVPDFQDPKTARLRHVNGAAQVLWNASLGAFSQVRALHLADSAFGGATPPSGVSEPYGAFAFRVVDLNPGAIVTLNAVFPQAIPASAKVYILNAANVWQEAAIDSRLGDAGIALRIPDGGTGDADGAANGVVQVKGILLATPAS